MRYYTTKEISCLLGFNVKTIQKLIRERKLKAYKVFGRYLVDEQALKEFMQAKQV